MAGVGAKSHVWCGVSLDGRLNKAPIAVRSTPRRPSQHCSVDRILFAQAKAEGLDRHRRWARQAVPGVDRTFQACSPRQRRDHEDKAEQGANRDTRWAVEVLCKLVNRSWSEDVKLNKSPTTKNVGDISCEANYVVHAEKHPLMSIARARLLTISMLQAFR